MKTYTKPERIEVKVNGVLRIGYRIVEGKRSLDQYIFYKGKCEKDLKSYHPSQKDSVMMSNAKESIRCAAIGRNLSFVRIPARFVELIDNIDRE